MASVLAFFLDILKVPAILVGLIAFIGLCARKKSPDLIIQGTIKTILGFLVLSGGAMLLVSTLGPLGEMFEHAFNMQGVIPNNEAIVSLSMVHYGESTAYIMAFGMVANIFLARFSRLKYIYLSGHVSFYMACMLAVILSIAGFSGVSLVICGSLVMGIFMVTFPAMAQPVMRKITGEDEVALAHTGTIGYILAAGIGRLVGKNSPSTEDLTLPKNLGFLRDSTISISLTMMIIYIILCLCSGGEYVRENISQGQNIIIFSVLMGITFAAGVYIILSGVRLILSEIIPAFQGFSEKLVPDARPALDCPIVYPYAPNAVLIGFVSSFAGGLAGLLLLGQLNWVLILPGVVPHFFTGATAGVFGNATGGRRGAVAGAFANGLLITFLPAILIPLLGQVGLENTTFSDSDYGVVGIVLGQAIRWISHEMIIAVLVAIYVVMIGYHQLNRQR